MSEYITVCAKCVFEGETPPNVAVVEADVKMPSIMEHTYFACCTTCAEAINIALGQM